MSQGYFPPYVLAGHVPSYGPSYGPSHGPSYGPYYGTFLDLLTDHLREKPTHLMGLGINPRISHLIMDL